MAVKSLNEIVVTQPPTSRLLLRACAGSATPLSIGNLAETTGATPGTLGKSVRKLWKKGVLARTSTGCQHCYSLAPETVNR